MLEQSYIYSRLINNKWYSYTEIYHTEYPDAMRVHHEVASTNGDKLGIAHYVQRFTEDGERGDKVRTLLRDSCVLMNFISLTCCVGCSAVLLRGGRLSERDGRIVHVLWP